MKKQYKTKLKKFKNRIGKKNYQRENRRRSQFSNIRNKKIYRDRERKRQNNSNSR